MSAPAAPSDPEKYFIILVNQIGNGLSSSPHNAAVPFNAARFPFVTIADDVRAQHRLVTEKFGLDSLALVLGGSMGAQQSYQWAVRYPDFVKRIAPIAGTAKGTLHNRLLVEGFIDAITSDPHWAEGWYPRNDVVHRGLRRHARLFATSGFTPALFNEAIWKPLGFSSVEDFLIGFVENHFVQQDPNNLLLLLRKWHANDVSRLTDGDLHVALSRIKAKTFVIAIDEDGFFPLHDIDAEQKQIPGSVLKRISSPWGHLALFGLDPSYNAQIDSHLRELLVSARRRLKPCEKKFWCERAKEHSMSVLEIVPTHDAADRPPINPDPLCPYVAWAGNRNRDPILKVFKERFPKSGRVLELASGAGNHVNYFAPHFKDIFFQPSDYAPEVLESIKAKKAESGNGNVADPIRIDLTDPSTFPDVQDGLYDVIFVVNVFQVAPVAIQDGIAQIAKKLLKPEGFLAIYGPFKVDGAFTTESNHQFDEELRTTQVQEWWLKDIRDLDAAAKPHGIVLKQVIDMPVNNFTLIFGKA